MEKRLKLLELKMKLSEFENNYKEELATYNSFNTSFNSRGSHSLSLEYYNKVEWAGNEYNKIKEEINALQR